MTETFTNPEIRRGRFAGLTPELIRETAASIGARPNEIGRLANDYRRREARAWLDEHVAWLSGIKVGEPWEEAAARQPAGLTTGSEAIDRKFEIAATEIVRMWMIFREMHQYKRPPRRAEMRRAARAKRGRA